MLISTILPRLLPWGGVERVVIAQLKQFINYGFAADLVLLNEPQNVKHSIPKEVRVFNLETPRFRHAVVPLVRYFRHERPNAIHAAMWALTSTVILAHKLSLTDARVIVSDHAPLSVQYSGKGRTSRILMEIMLRYTYPLAAKRVAVSQHVADDIAALSGLDRTQFEVIYNPVSFEIDENTDKTNAEMAWDGWTGPRILTVGRLTSEKNHALLLRAFQGLIQEKDCRLMILGTGELEQETLALLDSLGLTGRVFMPGHVENPMPYYLTADLFVLSSDYEGFGNVIVEALAAGAPIVSTDCGPASEILENGRFGLLVPVRDEKALAEAMDKALSRPIDKAQLKSRAAAFNVRKNAREYLELMFPNFKEVSHSDTIDLQNS